MVGIPDAYFIKRWVTDEETGHPCTYAPIVKEDDPSCLKGVMSNIRHRVVEHVAGTKMDHSPETNGEEEFVSMVIRSGYPYYGFVKPGSSIKAFIEDVGGKACAKNLFMKVVVDLAKKALWKTYVKVSGVVARRAYPNGFKPILAGNTSDEYSSSDDE